MKKIIILLTILLGISVSAVGLILVSPYYYYSKIIKNEYQSNWYSHPAFKKSFLTPSDEVEGSSSDLGNSDLWQKFHFMDVEIPMPVHNPFFYVAPVLSFDKKTKSTNFGIRLYSEGDREISKIFFIRNRLFPDALKSQRLFKLPLIKKELKKYSKEQIWKDLFTKKIENWNIPFSKMLYNLYLIQLRSKVLPDKFKSYSLVKDTSTAIIELESLNKDYTTEMILTYSRGLIYSFLLLTEKDNKESALVRYKFLNEVSFQGGSRRLAQILYLEFKGLNYKDQLDHKGMLYLLSAWTHEMNESNYIREMIENLEKGNKNQRQLENLYRYALDRYGKTFTRKEVDNLDVNDEVLLNRKVELERRKEQKELARVKEEINNKPIPLTEDQKLKRLLKKAKKNKKENNDQITID